MDEERAILEVASRTIRCGGPDDAPHPPVEVRTVRGAVVRCPVCGRRVRRVPAVRVGPAAWPSDD